MKIFKLTVLVVWLILFGILLQRDLSVRSINLEEATMLKDAREESYRGIYFRGKRIGWAHEKLSEQENDLLLVQESEMLLNILGKVHPVKMDITARLSRSFLLDMFTFRLTSPFYSMKAEGNVEGTLMRIKIDTGKNVTEDLVKLNTPPFISLHKRSFLLSQGLEKGDKIKIPWFDPISLTSKETTMVYMGLEKTKIKGRVELLHHFEEHLMGMVVNSWLNDKGSVVKEESPAGFIFLSEPEFKAKDITSQGEELLSTVAVRFSGKLPDLKNAVKVRYRLYFPEEAILDIDGGRQQWSKPELVIYREDVAGYSRKGCGNTKRALTSTGYIQSSSPDIVGLASTLSKGAENSEGIIKNIVDWTYNNIEKLPVIGVPDALTTLRSRTGDCNEHAALVAALGRAAGIPVRIAAGITLNEGLFYYHAWNEACINDSWISLDATTNQVPADLAHIRLITGETEEMVRIGAVMGKLKIEVLPE